MQQIKCNILIIFHKSLIFIKKVFDSKLQQMDRIELNIEQHSHHSPGYIPRVVARF